MSEQKSLGCMNSWNGKPIAYIQHEENCGTEYEYKHMLGPGNFEMRKARRYPVQSATLGRCYTRYECSQCKCNWTVDSSD
jgi:hypothetical protein